MHGAPRRCWQLSPLAGFPASTLFHSQSIFHTCSRVDSKNTCPIMSLASLNHLSGRVASPKVPFEKHHPGRGTVRREKKGGPEADKLCKAVHCLAPFGGSQCWAAWQRLPSLTIKNLPWQAKILLTLSLKSSVPPIYVSTDSLSP